MRVPAVVLAALIMGLQSSSNPLEEAVRNPHGYPPDAFYRAFTDAQRQASFTYSSDVETFSGGRLVLYNFIENTHKTASLVASWPKAKVYAPPPYGIPPGTRRGDPFDIDAYDIERDEPLTYTQSRESLRTSVYVLPHKGLIEKILKPLISRFTAAYLDADKIRRDLTVTVEVSRTEAGALQFAVSRTPAQVTLVLGAFGGGVSDPQLAAIGKVMNMQVSRVTLRSTIPDTQQAWFPADVLDEPLLSFPSDGERQKFEFAVPLNPAIGMRHAQGFLGVVDLNKRVIAAGRYSLYLPE